MNHGIPQDEAEKEVAKLSGGSAGDTARPEPSYDARSHIPTMAEDASVRWSVPESAEERYGNEVRRLLEDNGFDQVRIHEDSFGKTRFATGVKN